MPTLRQRITRAMDRRAHGGARLGPYEVQVTKDLRVPMDDGVELLADLYQPVGADGSLPTIVIRSPYGRRGPIGSMARVLVYEGFTVLFQTCRGTHGSGGVFHPQVDEQRDGIATYRWVRRQPWFTGRLATSGVSYMGYAEWAAAGRMLREDPEDAPEALVFQVTMPDFGAVTWDHGALALRNALGWSRGIDGMERGGLAMLSFVLPDRRLEKAFDVLPLSLGDTAATGHPIRWYQEWIRHESLADEYWTQQSHTASVPEVASPVFMIAGWHDIFTPWQLRSYRQLVDAGNPPRLTIGPWGHRSPDMSAVALREGVAFLRETFLGDEWDRTAPVRAYETGAGRWFDLAEWPPPGSAPQDWFLVAGGGMATDVAPTGLTSYTYDPDDPTPALGGPSLLPDTEPVDNADHEKRTDVVAFRTDPLAEPLDVAGEPVATVRIRSSAQSFDVFVRITDVHPDGRSMTVCDGIRRIGSVGTAETDPVPDADGFREVAVSLWPTFHRFAAGHRVGVQISSGAHPRYARNPGTGEPAFDAVRTVVAHQELAHGGAAGTRISLPVWSR
ncbi:CocE/NonD family hydrolase [Microbacterium thalassium]|uniref:Putative CocE/NonD family hydrolase n=1 Tax=Microbacterium thalassium TaxID=362649 RepID=A0A7X0FNL5_9MICO|nr:CocE/NonD family hydrolase [Microbacterium thalassium]MBB6390726.1 putative CocE/NonD family hydrolase [Microbacterium thalassium]GLK25835.1 X-Pro dipeptidyl-peptidase [Microbacterium thalassium]